MEDSSIVIAQAIASLQCADEVKTLLRGLFNQELLDSNLAVSYYVRQAEEIAATWTQLSDLNQ
jgi:hypothetical protein